MHVISKPHKHLFKTLLEDVFGAGPESKHVYFMRAAAAVLASNVVQAVQTCMNIGNMFVSVTISFTFFSTITQFSLLY